MKAHLVTQPIDKPVMASQSHHSNAKDLDARQSTRRYTRRQDSLVLLIVKFGETKDSSKREAKKHRVKKNKSGDAQPGDICMS